MKRMILAVLVMWGAAQAGIVNPPGGGGMAAVSTNGVAVFGPDIFFPSSNQPPRVVFSGIGSNHVFQGPSAVLRPDGNFLVCGRVAAKGDYYQGGIYMLAVAPDGWCLATNLVYRDPVYDSINSTIFRTKANTLLVAFNLDAWASGNLVPTNGVKWLRSTDGGAIWSTNTLATDGYMTMLAGTMVQRDDGVVLLPFYKQPTNGSAYVAYTQFSSDDGLTFGGEVKLADKRSDTNYPNMMEPNLTYLGGSNILALVRSDGVTQKCFSYDGGLTWTAPSNAPSLYGSANVNCVRLRNGLLLASGRSYFNNHVMSYWTSTNNGASWSADNRFIEARYGWADYSAAVPLDNGLVAMFSGYFLNDAYFGAGTNCPLTLTYGAYAGLTPQGDYVGPVDLLISNQALGLAVLPRASGTATNLTVLGTFTSTDMVAQVAAQIAASGGGLTNGANITNLTGYVKPTWCIGAYNSATLASNATSTATTGYAPFNASNIVSIAGRVEVPTNIPPAAVSNICICVAWATAGGGQGTETQLPLQSNDWAQAYAGYNGYRFGRSVTNTLVGNASGRGALLTYIRNLGFSGSSGAAVLIDCVVELAK